MEKLTMVILLIVLMIPFPIMSQETNDYLRKITILEILIVESKSDLQKLKNEIANLEADLKMQNSTARNLNSNLQAELQEALVEQQNLEILIAESKADLQKAYQSLQNSENIILENETQFKIDIENVRKEYSSDKRKAGVKGFFIGIGISGVGLILFSIFN